VQSITIKKSYPHGLSELGNDNWIDNLLAMTLIVGITIVSDTNDMRLCTEPPELSVRM